MSERNRPPKIHFKPVIRPPAVKPINEDSLDVKRELWQEALIWGKTLIVALMFAFVFNNFVIVNARVPSPSMEYTLMTNDRVVAFRWSYLFREPRRYEMIVFRGPPGDRTLYVKRVLGLPGETLLIRDGHVFINGSEVPQRYGFVKGEIFGDFGVINEETGDLEPILIPEGEFFVLGDWRANSMDSRRWEEINIPRGRILGRVIFRYFPGFTNLTNE